MRPLALLPLLALLAGCATPQEACISRVTKDLRVLNRLIAETEANVDRGYAIAREPYTTTQKYSCRRQIRTPDGPKVVQRICSRPVTLYRSRNVAIDPAAEATKLANMKLKAAELERRARAGVAACRAQYPEAG